MGFDSTIRELLGVADDISKTLQSSVYHYRWIKSDARGKKTFALGDPIRREAIVEMNPTIRYTRDGVIIPVRARVTILAPFEPHGAEGRAEPVDARDRFGLPDGSVGDVVGDPGIVDPSTERRYFAQVMIGEPTQGTGGGA